VVCWVRRPGSLHDYKTKGKESVVLELTSSRIKEGSIKAYFEIELAAHS
jgi:hypothetical protein